ncbi:MAG: lysophospholipid acyltransferase family protein [Chitinophagales bacterium]
MAKRAQLKKTASPFAFRPPSKAFVRSFMTPFKFYFAPQFYGLKELDVTRPALYVTNHNVLGVLDGYPFGTELYLRKGIILRALADSNHFRIPIWKDFVKERLGIVEASRANCDALMQEGESIVVYPGGTREICRKKGERYILKWSDRKGFVRMAAKHGYDIIPIAAVGAEEAFTVVKDADDFLKTPIGKFLTFIGVSHNVFKDGELIPPMVKGVGDTIIPRPVKLYFKFGKRISTKGMKRKLHDDTALDVVKSKVEDSLLEMIHELHETRRKDKDRSTLRRWLSLEK